MSNTIAAIATPPGIGGISVIRLSGDMSIDIAHKLFKSTYDKDIRQADSHTIHLGKIKRLDDKSVIDEVLLTIMRCPRTYTGEDVVEISCHGSIVATREILSQLVAAGASYAGPGEFTKRAFLNGRIDLSQAEAVIDIINSKNSSALTTSVNQLEGALSVKINSIRDRLVHMMAWIQAEADFPEEGISGLDEEKLKIDLRDITTQIDILIKSSKTGKLVRDGIETVIAGKPNAGKSSLLNSLLEETRAIVTGIPGTTRDRIEEYLNLGSVMLKLVDTAGIRETEDIIEKMGVDVSREYIERADLILYVADLSSNPTNEDIDIRDSIKDKKAILILNKSDIMLGGASGKYIDMFIEIPFVYTSAICGEGMEELKSKIVDMFNLGQISMNNELLITNIRHIEALNRAMESLSSANTLIKEQIPIDCLFIDLGEAIEAMGEITGQSVSEEIVDRIFSEFCVGK